MKKSLQKKGNWTIPTQLKEEEFKKYILPNLTMPKRGPKCKVGYWLIFNLILRVLYTGMQWKMLEIPKDENGKGVIHYRQVYRYFAKWEKDGSLEQVFIASVKHLQQAAMLDLSVINGDGTNTAAKKGAI
jgi:hypothetical protein